jgi:hypothetical protein
MHHWRQYWITLHFSQAVCWCVPHDSHNTQHETKAECVPHEEFLNLRIILRNFQASNIALRDSATFPPYQIDHIFMLAFWELLETLQMTICRIPRKGSSVLHFLSITASIYNANICYTPWSLLILDSCTELTTVSLYICELHIRIPTLSTTNGYTVCNQAVNIGGMQLISSVCSNCSVSSFTHSWHI